MNRRKLLQQLLGGRSDANIRFNDLRSLLLSFGFVERTRGSHHVYVKEGVEDMINLQREGSKAKPYRSDACSSVSDLETSKMHRYEVIIYWSEDDQAFVAEVPELPGCSAHGDSQNNALANCQDAIDLWLDTAEEFGRSVPVPKGRRLQYA